MTGMQEISNAITMLIPTVCLAAEAVRGAHPMVLVILVGTTMHLPVSFTYHLSAGCGRYLDRLDNDMRRLDQSMQHVAGTMFSFALSGSVRYTLCVALFNLVGVVQLWGKDTCNDGRRWVLVAICVALYTAPMLFRGDVANFLWAVAVMAIGGIFFAPELNRHLFRGWGHSVFHVVLWFFAEALVASARGVNVWTGLLGRQHALPLT